MKKTALVSLVSFTFLATSSAVAYLLRFTDLADWTALTVALVILGVSAIVALVARKYKWMNAATFVISATALGFAIRAWYVFRDFDNPYWKMLLVSLGCVAYLWVYHLLLRIPLLSRHAAVFTSAWLILSLLGYLALVFLTTTTWVSTFGYYMLIEIAFILAMYSETESLGELVRSLALSTFAVLGVIVFIAAMMASGGGDCDCDCSGCDCGGDCDIGSSKKKKGNDASDIKP